MPKSPTRPTQYPSPQWARELQRGKPRHSCRGGRPRTPGGGAASLRAVCQPIACHETRRCIEGSRTLHQAFVEFSTHCVVYKIRTPRVTSERAVDVPHHLG